MFIRLIILLIVTVSGAFQLSYAEQNNHSILDKPSAITTLYSDTSNVNIKTGIEYLTLSQRVHDPKQFLSEIKGKQWTALKDKTLNLDSFSGYTWIRFTVKSDINSATKWALNLSWPTLNFIELFNVDESSNSWQLINRIENRQPEYQGATIAPYSIKVQLPPSSQSTFYLQIKGVSKIIIPLSLTQYGQFKQDLINGYIITGLFFGILVAMLGYNAVLAVYLKSSIYAIYCTYISMITAYTLFMTGIGPVYIWPNFSFINNYAYPMFSSMSFMTAGLFIRSFLDLSSFGRWPLKLANSCIFTWAVLAILFLFFQNKYMYITADLLGLYSCIITMTICVYFWKYGYKSAKFLCIAWGVLISATLYLTMSLSGLVSYTPLALHIQFFGFIIEVFLLSMALGYKIYEQRQALLEEQKRSLTLTIQAQEAKEREFIAQQRTLSLEKNARIELEKRVQEKTHELKHTLASLEKANQELSAISQTDGLTALSNRRHFDCSLVTLESRAKQDRLSMSILMIDIDHFKIINDKYGHLTGDECIKYVAKVLKHHIGNNMDLCARYGGEEFCMVFLDKTVHQIMQIAETIRKEIELLGTSVSLLKEQGVHLTVSIGVTQSDINHSDESHQLLQDADRALYTAKQSGRNRVSFRDAELIEVNCYS